MGLIGHGWADNGWPEPKTDWITNPFGWPTRFGLGDEAAQHPVDFDYPMVVAHMPPFSETHYWDERLQLEYAR